MKEASWKKAFPEIYHEIRGRYPQGNVAEASLIYLACKENLLDSQTYLTWAHRYYAIAILEDRFFEERFDRTTFEKFSGSASWSEDFFPVFEWDGVLFVACMDPYALSSLKLEIMVRPLLASFENLFKSWLILTGHTQSRFVDPDEFDKTIPSIVIDSQIVDASQLSAQPHQNEDHSTDSVEPSPPIRVPDTQLHEDFDSLEIGPSLNQDEPIALVDEELLLDYDVEDNEDEGHSAESEQLDLLDDIEAPQLTGIEDQESLVTQLKTASDIPDGLFLAEEHPLPPKVKSKVALPNEDLFPVQQRGPTPTRVPENKIPVLNEIQDLEQFKVPPQPNTYPEHPSAPPPRSAEALTKNQKSNLPQPPERPAQVQRPAPPKPPFAKTPIEAPPLPPPLEPPPIEGALDFERSQDVSNALAARTSLTSATQSTEYNDVLMTTIKDKMGLAYNFYNKIMFLVVNSNETVTPIHWDQHFKPKGVTSPIPLFQPSPFRIAYRTNKPYHGKTHSNSILQKFSTDWLNGESIYFLTVTPLISDGSTFALLLGISNNDIDSKDSLNNFLSVTDEITKQITLSAKSKTA